MSLHFCTMSCASADRLEEASSERTDILQTGREGRRVGRSGMSPHVVQVLQHGDGSAHASMQERALRKGCCAFVCLGSGTYAHAARGRTDAAALLRCVCKGVKCLAALHCPVHHLRASHPCGALARTQAHSLLAGLLPVHHLLRAVGLGGNLLDLCRVGVGCGRGTWGWQSSGPHVRLRMHARPHSSLPKAPHPLPPHPRPRTRTS